jgi:hypothetical protein
VTSCQPYPSFHHPLAGNSIVICCGESPCNTWAMVSITYFQLTRG